MKKNTLYVFELDNLNAVIAQHVCVTVHTFLSDSEALQLLSVKLPGWGSDNVQQCNNMCPSNSCWGGAQAVYKLYKKTEEMVRDAFPYSSICKKQCLGTS